MDRIFITPLANKLASLNSIDINSVKGTGPRGRITKIDIEKHIAPSASAIEAKQKNKLNPIKYEKEFIKLNASNIGENNTIFIGQSYLLPTKTDTLYNKEDTTSVPLKKVN